MLQSSFFGGPRGKDFLITKIFPNAAEAKKDISSSNITDVKPDDYIMISYGILSDDTESEYIANLNKDAELNKDRKINYNAKIYQKIIKNKNTIISDNDLDGDNYIYKFIIDLSSQLKINFNDEGAAGGVYSLSYDESIQEYKLNMPQPKIEYDSENNKLIIKLNGVNVEEEVGNKITNYNYNIEIPEGNKIFYSLQQSTETPTFVTAFENAIANKEFIKGQWYLIECEYNRNGEVSYWTIFAYAKYTGKGKGSITYSKVAGGITGSSEQLPSYIKDDGIYIADSSNEQQTSIKTDGLIYTRNRVLPGQIVKKDKIGAGESKYYIAAGVSSSNMLYYEPSPLEKKLYQEIDDLTQTTNNATRGIKTLQEQVNSLRRYDHSALPQTIYTINNVIDDTTNFYKKTSTSSTDRDVFVKSATDTGFVNSTYLNQASSTTDTLNLYSLTKKLGDLDLTNYNKLVLGFNYEILSDNTKKFYLSLINVNASRKERITSLDLLNGFQNFEIILKKKQDGKFYLSSQNLKDDWTSTYYYSPTLYKDSWTSTTELTTFNIPFFENNNFLYLSVSTSTPNTTYEATSSYYKDFKEYFDSFSVILKGYKN